MCIHGGKIMTKRVTFGEKDLELVKKIEEFQKKQELPYFIEAVRILCKKGLDTNEFIKNQIKQ